MKITVQKFGGTCMATDDSRRLAVQRIRQAQADGFRPVVVVSAIGRAGYPYATDTLKGLAEKKYPAISLRELDLLMSCGEIIAAVVMVATLQEAGIKARAFTGMQAGLYTDGTYGAAQVVSCRPEKIQRCLEQDEVAVVAGFQGAGPEGEINTLGRGGSDTTAVILGAALQAELVEIYTDVEGISTADPNLLKEARVIPQLSYTEVCQLAYEGARVIHPAAVEVAMKHNVTVVVRSLEGEKPGTVISSSGSIPEDRFSARRLRVVAGIAHSSGVAQIIIDFPEPDPDREMQLFDALGRAGVSIDLISVFPNMKIFTVKENILARAENVLGDLGLKFRVETGCAKVSVVGLGMRDIPGVMAKVVRALREQNVSILQTADSNITITLLIKEADLVKAVQTLHAHFHLDREESYPNNAIKTS